MMRLFVRLVKHKTAEVRPTCWATGRWTAHGGGLQFCKVSRGKKRKMESHPNMESWRPFVCGGIKGFPAMRLSVCTKPWGIWTLTALRAQSTYLGSTDEGAIKTRRTKDLSQPLVNLRRGFSLISARTGRATANQLAAEQEGESL